MILYCGQWVWARPMLNKKIRATGECTMCKHRSLNAGWHNVKTNEFRCRNCFDAEAEHHEKTYTRHCV